ncbi:MAG: hypothetical protein FJ095_03965 [Deltaproteobacteria bacterium]|nr:hypothetical protein [Deltaproteobacteria bacterium]
MKTTNWILGALAVGLVVAACGGKDSDDVTTGSGSGAGGNTTSSSSASSSSGKTSSVVGPTSSSGGSSKSCDDIGTCEGDQMDPASGCFECAILGDSTTAVDGGACFDSYSQCFGTKADCSDAGNKSCCDFVNCIQDCPKDDPKTADVDENLNCLCTNDGMKCLMTEPTGSMTCIGKHGVPAVQDYLEFVNCVIDSTCPVSCAQ